MAQKRAGLLPPSQCGARFRLQVFAVDFGHALEFFDVLGHAGVFVVEVVAAGNQPFAFGGFCSQSTTFRPLMRAKCLVLPETMVMP